VAACQDLRLILMHSGTGHNIRGWRRNAEYASPPQMTARGSENFPSGKPRRPYLWNEGFMTLLDDLANIEALMGLQARPSQSAKAGGLAAVRA
jgi:hypothetical protein